MSLVVGANEYRSGHGRHGGGRGRHGRADAEPDGLAGLRIRGTSNPFFMLLHRARSRLYRRRSLQVNTSIHFQHFSRFPR